MKPFIQDIERILDSTSDLLKTKVYADNLVRVIENTPEDKVFTIGVFGGWGTGKSSIIKTAQDEIERKHKSFKFISYDAWKYSNDSFRRMFLLKVLQELRLQPTDEMNRFYQSENVESEPRTVVSANRVAIAVLVIAIVSLVILFIPKISDTWKIAVPTIGSLGALFYSLLNGCLYDLKISISKPALFAPEQFEECFKEMMSKCLKKQNWFQRKLYAINSFVFPQETSLTGLEKLIIVIDNIDRCSSDIAYQLLTDIKTFLSNEENSIVFIIPVDDEALKKHLIFRRNKGSESTDFINKEKEEFLRKFFNVTLRIKPHQEEELQYFAHKINDENYLGYSNDTLAIVSKKYADNPRRIIQLFNNLNGEISLYDDDFIHKYESAICASLIIREEYPDFYKAAARDLRVLEDLSLYVKGTDDAVTTANLNDFMRIIGPTFRKIPIDARQLLFTNTSSIYSDVPDNTRKAVTFFDSDKVISFSEENPNLRPDLVNYAINKLKTDVKYKSTTQNTQWIEFISKLYRASVFEDSLFADLDNELSSSYKEAISVTDELDALCLMASKMCSAGYKSFRNSFLEFLRTPDDSSHNSIKEVLDKYLIYFTGTDDCKEVYPVIEDYFVNHTINREIPYTEIQIKQLFGDAFVNKKIEHLSALTDGPTMNDIAWCLKNNKDLSKSVFESLLGKCSVLFGNTRGKSKDNYLDFIRQLQPILEVIDTKSLGEDTISIYSLVVGPRVMPPQRPGMAERRLSIVDEVDNESAKPIIDFCYEMMRLFGDSINISDSIKKLYTKNKQAVIEGAVRLHKLGLSIAPLANILSQASDFESTNDLSCLEILLTPQADESFMLNEDVLKTKLHSLVDQSTNKSVEQLLNSIISNKIVSEIVTDYVASLNSETLNSLPVSISRHAVASFNKDNASSFKDNTGYLIQVLKQGKATQIEQVVRLMKEKIIAEEDIDSVVLVLNNLETNNQTLLKSVLGELDTLKDKDTFSEETKKSVSELSSKLSTYLKEPEGTKPLFRKKRKV